MEYSNATDKDMERTSVVSFLHNTLSHWAGHAGCQECYAHNPREFSLGADINLKLAQSATATLKGGEVTSGDVVAMLDGRIGKVTSFWQSESNDTTLYAQVDVHEHIACFDFEAECSEHLFIDVKLIIEPVMWYRKKNTIFAIVPMA